jgi:iron-sulfur cluster repair protein YtfE (RIC family)
MSQISEQTPPVAFRLPTGSGSTTNAAAPSGVIRMTGAIQTNRSDLFGPLGRRAALVAAYRELDDVCTALGFGVDLSLGEWSTSPAWAVMTLARAARPPQPAPERDWSMATIPELIADIVAAHHIPLRHELERLAVVIDHLAAVHQHAVFTALRKVYHDFKDALSLHLDQEECDLFPLCIALEEALGGRQVWEDQDVTSLIRFTGHGHAECDSGLRRIMGLIQAAAASSNDPDISVVSDGVSAMARDLAMHTAKEGELLLPAAIFSEEQLRARRSAGRIQLS